MSFVVVTDPHRGVRSMVLVKSGICVIFGVVNAMDFKVAVYSNSFFDTGRFTVTGLLTISNLALADLRWTIAKQISAQHETDHSLDLILGCDLVGAGCYGAVEEVGWGVFHRWDDLDLGCCCFTLIRN